MARNKVEICGVDTSTLPVLKNEEMRKLFVLMQNGDEFSREKLVNGNLRLVLSVIQRFNNRGEYVDDLFQVGCIGLMKSIDNFDLSQNVRFSTYAVPMIIGEIRRYLRDNNPIRVSRSLRDIAYKALQVKEKLISRTPASQQQLKLRLNWMFRQKTLSLRSMPFKIQSPYLNPFIMMGETQFL